MDVPLCPFSFFLSFFFFLEKLHLEEFIKRKDLDIRATLGVHEYTSLHHTLLLLLSLFFFWLHWVFVAARGLSLVAVSRGYSSSRCVGFSLQWLLLLWSMGCRHMGLSSCTTWALECRGFSSCGAWAQ